jgi:hypothetical protein
MTLAELFPNGRMALPVEVVVGVEAAVRSDMPLSPGVSIDSVALRLLDELAFLRHASQIAVTDWAKSTVRQGVAAELEHIGE